MTTCNFDADWLSPPGETITSALEDRELDKALLETALGATIDNLDELLRGDAPLTEEVARVLEEVIGGSASFWLRREEQYRTALLKRTSELDLSECIEWLARIPVSEMASRGDFRPSSEIKERTIQCLRFFGVPNVSAWEERYSPIVSGASFRTSGTFESDPAAVALWLREGQLRTSTVTMAKWDPSAVRQRLTKMRHLTRVHKPAEFVPMLSSLCSECGISLVVKRAPSKCRASGAVMALPRNRMLMMLSFRHLSDDHFWFTFFHELGHLLLHIESNGLIIDEGETHGQMGEEAEANNFAGSILIPESHHTRLFALRRNMWQVGRFARQIGVSPGIVVGQLQHLNHFRHNQMNHLKRRYTEAEVDAVSL